MPEVRATLCCRARRWLKGGFGLVFHNPRSLTYGDPPPLLPQAAGCLEVEMRARVSRETSRIPRLSFEPHAVSMFHVKPSAESTEIAAAAVHRTLAEAGLDVSLSECALLALHAQLVLEANAAMNLTRIVAPDDVMRLHIADSLRFLCETGPLTGHVIDIGSGAGYPGIPLAILGYDVELCESVKKKARFLSDCVKTLGLETGVTALRAEELALQAPGSADCVVARAVSALASLVELASPLLKMGGRLIALKGDPERDEIDRGARVAALCGMRQTSKRPYTLPGGEVRTVVEYTRVAKPRQPLPRRVGLAQRQPMG